MYNCGVREACSVQGPEVFRHLLAAGGFNLGGASSAAATPAFGQAPPASPGFAFGATGVCQTGLELL